VKQHKTKFRRPKPEFLPARDVLLHGKLGLRPFCFPDTLARKRKCERMQSFDTFFFLAFGLSGIDRDYFPKNIGG